MVPNFSRTDKLIFHYQRDDGNYEFCSLWIWELPHKEGREILFSGIDDFGAFASITIGEISRTIVANGLGIIIKNKGTWDYKDGGDKTIDFADLKRGKDGCFHLYLKTNLDDVFINEKLDSINTFSESCFISMNEFEVQTNKPFKSFQVLIDGNLYLEKTLDIPTSRLSCHLLNNDEVIFSSKYEIIVCMSDTNTQLPHTLSKRKLFKTQIFNERYAYSGELGAIVKGDKTEFIVWSPVSKTIKLVIYKNGTPIRSNSELGSDEVYFEAEMTSYPDGTFRYEINKNLHGFYYTYKVTNDTFEEREITDPYTKSVGINGHRGMVVDFSKTNEGNFDNIRPLNINPNELVVYETHIADLTSSETWTNDKNLRKYAKTFLGACASGTTYKENGRVVTTGFDHIKELGVNAVQLQPIFDHANNEKNMVYNWGYDPMNFNSLEGGYSSNPYDGLTRIFEFKKLVREYHDAGINIIMDVVFNHTYLVPGSNFDVLVPGYYFRYDDKGSLTNGSGCGNETASEMIMMRKFIVDSCLFFAKEYELGGFRFDLMGVHDLETMNVVAKKLHEYNENIIIYGEPWCGGNSSLPRELSVSKERFNDFKGYGMFNDEIRDSLIKETYGSNGWCVTSNKEDREDQLKICSSMKGYFNSVFRPYSLVNYASCHDNRTLFDKLRYIGINSESEAIKICLFANSIILTSAGTSFVFGGEEFARTKGGLDNTYNASYKINELDYSLKIKNFNTFKAYKKLIEFKKTFGPLYSGDINHSNMHMDSSLPNVISYEFKDVKSYRHFKVIHVNPLLLGRPVSFNLEGYSLFLDTINSNKELSSNTVLVPFETLIAYK